jgi:threonine dehydrogenase-like Zn-dependent dehydrogenase
VFGIDRLPERLKMARRECGAATINYEQQNVYEALADMTGGRGPDACIEAVGMEAHMTGLVGVYDRVKTAIMLETGRPHALREAIMACRNGGTMSVAGVFGGFIDKMPIGSLMNRSITMRPARPTSSAT